MWNIGYPVNRAASLNRGLVAWWLQTPQRISNARLLDIWGTNHGTLNGNASFSGPHTSGPTTRIGGWGAVKFDGVSDYVQVPDAAVLDTGYTAWSCGGWINRAGAQPDTGFGGFIRKGLAASGDPPYAMYLKDAGFRVRLNTTVDNNNANFWEISNNFVIGEWHHVFCTWASGGTPAIYFNGLAQSLSSSGGTLTGTLVADALNLFIGGVDASGTLDFFGSLDDIRLYNRSLTAEEVGRLYTASRGGYPLELNWLHEHEIVDSGAAAATIVTAPVSTHSYLAGSPQVKAMVRPGQVVHTYTGRVPTFRGTQRPPQVTHAYVGLAPQVKAMVRPGAAVHTYTARTPQAKAVVRPAQATHSYVAVVPGITAGVGFFPPAASHSYAGQAPQVRVQVQVGLVIHTYTGLVAKFVGTQRAPTASHVYTGPVPRLIGTQKPPVVTHSYLPRNPQVKARVGPAQATHTYVGVVPNIQAGAATNAPTATHAYLGRAPQVRARIQPGLAVHTYTGQTPQARAKVQPARVQHVYTPQTPQARASVAPGPAVHTYTGRAPQLKSRVQPPQATHVYTGRIAGMFTGSTFFPPAATHSYIPRAPKAQVQVRAAVAWHTYTAKVPTYVAQIAYTSEPLRARIGGTSIVDTHTRVGAAQVSDEHMRIGGESVVDAQTRVGGAQVADKNERIGPEVTGDPKRIGGPAE